MVSERTAAFRRGLRPDPELTVTEWANSCRVLTESSSPEPGPWRTSRTPYLQEIMDELSPSSPTTDIVFMKGAQIGGSECGNNWCGYVIDQAPGPMMIVEPTVELAKRYSRQRVAPMIRHSLALRGKVKDSRSRDSGNTILVKEFQGGILVLTGANSAAGLRMMPVRYLFRDEIDAYPDDCDGEGDPLSLSEARTANYGPRRKVFDVSTPTETGTSKIEKKYEASDQRRYFVPCPFCDHRQWLRWANIVFEKNEAHEIVGPVRYRCEWCEKLIDEHFKTRMLERGEWVPTSPGEGKPAGFHLSSLYSPLGWRSWRDIVKKFLQARKDRDTTQLKSWTNTDLGETWEVEGLTVDDGSLLSRREEYTAEVPRGVVLLTAGVDVQHDRLLVKVKGWGEAEESWLIAWKTLLGDPSTDDKVWQDLDEMLLKRWRHALGSRLPIAAVCVDSGGHATKQVYDFCRSRWNRRVYAIKGQEGMAQPIIRLSTSKKRRKLALGLVGTDTCKGLIYSRLNLEEFGPGYMHFPKLVEVDGEYFKQLTAEKQVTRYTRGFPKKQWIKVRARNEALDCEAYAMAALVSLNADLAKLAMKQSAQVEKQQVVTDQKEPPRKMPPSRPSPSRRGGFVSNW
jgi:phage terminase large subunit GpA-like protein